jgi:hypothetical protein
MKAKTLTEENLKFGLWIHSIALREMLKNRSVKVTPEMYADIGQRSHSFSLGSEKRMYGKHF